MPRTKNTKEAKTGALVWEPQAKPEPALRRALGLEVPKMASSEPLGHKSTQDGLAQGHRAHEGPNRLHVGLLGPKSP